MRNGYLIENRYEIESYRSSNAAVELYDAVDRQLSRPVTLQILREDAARNAAFVREFEERQKLALSLYHCSVLAVYDVGAVDGRPFSVMERFNRLAPADFRVGRDAPDVDTALRLTRQAADGLDCCRTFGLTGWAFTLDVIGLDGEGNARLAIIDGEARAAGQQAGGEDAAALGALLRSLLVGREHARREELDALGIPLPVLTLLDQMERGADARPLSAGEVVREIAAIEEASNHPTQSYSAGAVMASISGISPEAPTLPSPVLHAMLVAPEQAKATMALPVGPLEAAATVDPGARALDYAGVAPGPMASKSRFVWLGVLLALFLLVAVVLPRLAGSVLGAAIAGDVRQESAPSPTVVPLVQAPDLRGKSLEEAQILAGGFRLNVAVGIPGEDAALPPNTIMRQEPVVGTILLSGDVITVSLNLPAQAKPAPPPPPAVGPDPPADAAQPPNEGNQNQGRDKNKGKNRDNENDKDDDD